MSRLSPVDAAFLHIEDRSNRMQLAGVLIFDGPAPDFASFRDEIARCLPHLPHFRQRLRRSTLGVLRPSWVDDDAFDLDYHLRRVALPQPGGHAEIAALIDEMTALPLDLQRPLWELTLVEGIDGGFGIALKVHHCMVDGLSIMDIFAVLCSPDPDRRHPSAPPWTPEPVAPWWKRVDARLPDVPDLLTTARRLRRATALTGRAPATRFNSGPSSAVRRTEYLTVPIDVVHDIRSVHATTVNNTVLAVVTGALRSYLVRHDELVDSLHAFVPVNRRDPKDRGTLGNQIAMTYPALPVGEPDPGLRIGKVIVAVGDATRDQQADDTAALLHLTRFAPQPIAAAVNRVMQFDSDMFNLTVTNVPGPAVPVYFQGRELRMILGATPLTRKHALTIAVLSYRGELTFSVTTDPRRVPDVAEIVADIRAANELLHSL